MCRKWQYVKQTEHVCECEDSESEYVDEVGNKFSSQPCFFASCFSHISFSSANDHWSGGEVCAWETFIIKAIFHRSNGWDVVERRQRRTRCSAIFFPSYFPLHFGGHVRLVLCAPRERQRANENRKLASKPNLDRHTLKRTQTQSNSSIFSWITQNISEVFLRLSLECSRVWVHSTLINRRAMKRRKSREKFWSKKSSSSVPRVLKYTRSWDGSADERNVFFFLHSTFSSLGKAVKSSLRRPRDTFSWRRCKINRFYTSDRTVDSRVHDVTTYQVIKSRNLLGSTCCRMSLYAYTQELQKISMIVTAKICRPLWRFHMIHWVFISSKNHKSRFTVEC